MKKALFLLLAAAAKLVSARDDIHVLMYETDTSLQDDPTSPLAFFMQQSSIADMRTTVYGGGLEYHGFGDKYQTLKALLEVIDPNKLVVIADARDVALNIPKDEEGANAAIDRFLDTYDKLTANDPHAVVMSSESQCCVSAMTHAHPSEYFDPITKKRTKRACSSGKAGCYWSQNDNIYAWVDFHRERAFNKTGIERVGEDVGDVYLNAGLMAGYPEDLINLVNVLDIAPEEDDQAVLSGLMNQFPDMIVLDYNQEMFGNNQWPQGLENGCVFEKNNEILAHRDTKTEPLIIHTPGKFYGCLDVLIEELGGVSQQRYLKESPAGNPRKLRREGKQLKIEEEEAQLLTEQQPQRELSDCSCECGSSRRMLMFGRFFERWFGTPRDDQDEIGPRTRLEDPKFSSRLSVEEGIEVEVPIIFEEAEETEISEISEEPEETNYGTYGQYGVVETANYGQYDVVGRSNYGNYGQYGFAKTVNYGNYGQYGDVSVRTASVDEEDADANYGNYGQYGIAGAGYGQYGVVGRSSNYGAYGNYGQYGTADTCVDICASECAESANYGVRRRLH